jgi:transposase InsO family protein
LKIETKATDSPSHSPHERERIINNKLLEIAGMGNISATSYMLRQMSSQDTNFIFRNASKNKNEKKIYIPIYLNKFRLIACTDTGSDVTLMQNSLFKTIFPYRALSEASKNITILSFSGTKIEIVGMFETEIRFDLRKDGIFVNILVIPDNPTVPTFLFGNDSLRAGLVTFAYNGTVENPIPEIAFFHPSYHKSTVYYVSPEDAESCYCDYDIAPFETKDAEFLLHPAATVIRKDTVLLTSVVWGSVNIVPSLSTLEYNPGLECYSATGCIVNLCNEHLKGQLVGRFEIANKYKTVPIKEDNKSVLRQTLQEHPFSREVLYCHSNVKNDLSILTVHNISMSDNIPDIADGNLANFTPENTIMKGEPTYTGEAEIKPEIIEPQGLDLPTTIYDNAADAINLSAYSEDIRPFIKDIFINKYPEVVALHAIDAGDLSLTLGLTQLRLRPGEVLPRCKRIFHMSPPDTRHLEDICELLIKFGYLIRAPMAPNDRHLYGMASYLVPRSKPATLGRLIVDYSPVNTLLQSPPSVIPEINATLQFLQGKALYTSLDLKYAYLSLKIDKESQALTTFLTPTGAFQWTCIPTGASNSPAYFTEASNKMLHYSPVKDSQGNYIYEAEGVVKLKKNVLPWVTSYFDDILATSPLMPTYQATLKRHFEILEEVVKRLAFHGSKISIMKSDFAKAKILFLGWYVCNNYVIADPRRIEKIKDFKFPESKKAMRSFLGLINSLRRVIYLNIIKEVALLTPLTSSTQPYITTDEHKAAFLKLKQMLVSEPLFNHLIDEKAPKYLWVDASTSSGVLGAVLAQKRQGVPDEKIVPSSLDLDDKIHRLIFDKELKYEPTQLYLKLPIELPKPQSARTVPPKICTLDKYLGFTEETINDTFCLSTASILAIYNCKPVKSTFELRDLAVKELKKGILALKMRDFLFDNNFGRYKQFLDEFKQGKHDVDKNFYLVEALAIGLYRPIFIISSLREHSDNPILKFNHNSNRPPLIYGLYEVENRRIFKPFYLNRNITFNLDALKGKIEIVAYLSKTVPEGFKSRGILDLEVFSILTALYSLSRYISGVPVTLLTDNKCLYYLFSEKVGNSSVKIKRWCLKLLSDHSNVTLHFVKTSENLSDFLTREGMPIGDLEKLDMKTIEVSDFYDKLPKSTFTLAEWAQFCADNPNYLTVNTEPVKQLVFSIHQGLANIKDVVTPIEILRERLSRSEIIRFQKQEFANIYTACLAGENFEYIDENSPEQTAYKLVSDLLMIDKDFYKILFPTKLIGLLLSYTHLLGHKGLLRMLSDLESYHFENKNTVVKRFVRCCYACFLSHKSSRKQKLGVYPTPAYPLEEVCVDLIESLNTVNGYSHILVTMCALTDYVILTPLKTKTSSEVNRAFLYSVLQQFNVKRVHQDNAMCFRSQPWLNAMSALGITIINTSAIHPAGRGQIEREVGLVKLMMKKMLATSTNENFNWEMLPFLCAKIMNNSISTKTNCKPCEMVFGKENTTPIFLDKEKLAPPHHLVKTNKQHIELLSEDISKMVNEATERLTQLRLISNERVNKTRISKDFATNDIVFALDRFQIQGNTRPLKLKFYPSPYVVLRPLWTTTLVRRLSDGFCTLYNNDSLKKYSGADPLFATLPTEIKRVLLHTFQDFLSSDFTTIAKFDDFSLPEGIQLYNPEEANDPILLEVDGETNMSPNIENIVENLPDTVQEDDKNLPLQNFENDDEIENDPLFNENVPLNENIQNLENDNNIADKKLEPKIQPIQTEDDTDDEPEPVPSIMTRSRARANKNNVHFAPNT